MAENVSEAPRKEFAGVWIPGSCCWCGKPSEALGIYLDLRTGNLVVRHSCEIHTEDLVALIDGLTEGRLVESAKVPAEEMN
jgi:hypothetical protein